MIVLCAQRRREENIVPLHLLYNHNNDCERTAVTAVVEKYKKKRKNEVRRKTNGGNGHRRGPWGRGVGMLLQLRMSMFVPVCVYAWWRHIYLSLWSRWIWNGASIQRYRWSDGDSKQPNWTENNFENTVRGFSQSVCAEITSFYFFVVLLFISFIFACSYIVASQYMTASYSLLVYAKRKNQSQR